MSVSLRVLMADPAGEYRLLKDEIDAGVARVLASGRYVLGPEAEAFEREFAAAFGAAHAVGVNSGTDALRLALLAAGVAAGDEVVVPAFTFFATAEAVSEIGAAPVFADVDARTFNLDAASLERAITRRTRAVVVVHLFGQCADLDAIVAICRGRGVVVVEDCAQALGASWRGRAAGTWGDFGCFSFYPTKNLAAAGDAGLVVARAESHAATLRMLRHHGSRTPYEHEAIGWNSRLDELQAAVLRVKLRRLPEFLRARRRIASAYGERLAGSALGLPYEDPRGVHAFNQFTIRSPRRDALREALTREGIASAIFYPRALHHEPPFAEAHRGDRLPVAEALAREALSLPMHPLLSEEALARVCAAMRA